MDQDQKWVNGNSPDTGNVWRYEERNGEKIVTNGEQELKIGEEINYDCTKMEMVGEMPEGGNSPGGENPPGGNFPAGDRPEPPGSGSMGEPGKAPPQGDNNGGEMDSPIDEEMLSYTTELAGEKGEKYIYNAKEYKGKWGILGAENGKILITTMENVKNTKGELYFSGKTGYKKGITELDKISEIYGHGKGADGGRSITVEDIDQLTGYKPNSYDNYGYTFEFYWKKFDANGSQLCYRETTNRFRRRIFLFTWNRI